MGKTTHLKASRPDHDWGSEPHTILLRKARKEAWRWAEESCGKMQRREQETLRSKEGLKVKSEL
jgi:hypothetical protein